MARVPAVPFVPKSNRTLRTGHFWDVPLPSGRFACGRVLAIPAFGPTDRTGLVAGLLDWSSDELPTTDSIAGATVVEQAKARFETIGFDGGAIRGLRSIEDDDLVVTDPDASGVGTTHRVWGAAVIGRLARERFA